VGSITQAAMVQACIDVNGLTEAQKLRLFDEVYEQQPNLLASVLVLPRMGVSMTQLEVPLHILLVTFQAMKLSGRTQPAISEEVQETCLQRLTARAQFNEGLPDQLATKIVKQFCDEHVERYLLAFVCGYLGDNDLLQVRTDAEKFLLLAVLNLVECVAFAGCQTPTRSKQTEGIRNRPVG
jgi:hypothetical protein